MQYKILGRTGLRVSVIGYVRFAHRRLRLTGGAVLGIPYYLAREDTTDPATQAAYTAAIERALELGINYFDTAPGYGNGTSETILGNALSTYRDLVFLASKVTYSYADDFLFFKTLIEKQKKEKSKWRVKRSNQSKKTLREKVNWDYSELFFRFKTSNFA